MQNADCHHAHKIRPLRRVIVYHDSLNNTQEEYNQWARNSVFQQYLCKEWTLLVPLRLVFVFIFWICKEIKTIVRFMISNVAYQWVSQLPIFESGKREVSIRLRPSGLCSSPCYFHRWLPPQFLSYAVYCNNFIICSLLIQDTYSRKMILVKCHLNSNFPLFFLAGQEVQI